MKKYEISPEEVLDAMAASTLEESRFLHILALGAGLIADTLILALMMVGIEMSCVCGHPVCFLWGIIIGFGCLFGVLGLHLKKQILEWA